MDGQELSFLSLHERVRWHLAHRFVPALPDVWTDPAIATIWAANEHRCHVMLDITDVVRRAGVMTPREAVETDGRVMVSVEALLRALQLHDFVVVVAE